MKNIFLLGLFIGLFSCEKVDASGEIEVIKLVESSTSWNGDKLPSYPEKEPKLSILKFTIPPNTKMQMHKHLAINAGVLVKGELMVISEYADTLFLKEGDPIVELYDTWHFGENLGSVPAEIIVFYAGEEGTPITILKNEEE
ncbi:cupin domain-containing protein [Algoriphagus machipongonensis]|uniref:Cupin domain protein n=1 Tax=Algoriphagus machipongonensis TaxID=388413 RepID=A3HWZ1_9BACT|nr:cupin domain-containing protein [Algoriphagus machipongonensis]EAZ81114.1 hypothetical protein ALPR1_18798 [Algoriphagus machipongonensis]